jgi:hypothetical protein
MTRWSALRNPKIQRISTRFAAAEGFARDATSCEGAFEIFADAAMVQFRAAGKDVHRGVGMFGPGVDGYVRLRDDDDSADAVRAEIVKYGLNYFAAAFADCRAKERFDGTRAPETMRIAAVIFKQGVMAEGAHALERKEACRSITELKLVLTVVAG